MGVAHVQSATLSERASWRRSACRTVPARGKALLEHLRRLNWEPPLLCNARVLLAVAGQWPDNIRIEHEEGTPEALASEWLINFRHLMRNIELVAGGDTGAKAVSALVYSAGRGAG